MRAQQTPPGLGASKSNISRETQILCLSSAESSQFLTHFAFLPKIYRSNREAEQNN